MTFPPGNSDVTNTVCHEYVEYPARAWVVERGAVNPSSLEGLACYEMLRSSIYLFIYLFTVYFNGVSSPCSIGIELMNRKEC